MEARPRKRAPTSDGSSEHTTLQRWDFASPEEGAALGNGLDVDFPTPASARLHDGIGLHGTSRLCEKLSAAHF